MTPCLIPRPPSCIFTAKDYENAIKFYSQAIELNPSNAIYYGTAAWPTCAPSATATLADATRAIEMDKKYIKGLPPGRQQHGAGQVPAALRDYETGERPEPGWC